MRIAIVSDIHGNLAALEAVAADIGRRGADAVINLGDSLSGPLLPLETARYLMASGWTHLAGNHERQILACHAGSAQADIYARGQLTAAELAWIATLRPALQYAPDVLLCHGSPDSDVTGLLQTAERNASVAEVAQRLGAVTAALVACGHTHVARSVRTARGQLLVNPGSVGQPAYRDEYPHPHVIESGAPDARYAMVERRAGVWQASLHSVPYDHAAMAALAARNGRGDWAIALATGYLSP
ncbi:metallophosphoesterase family protein [Janthinobacterium fluminis]|uniref:Metallophosphoesterase family protein n=1 Tax=Janthinobacterium fluminis TaxID=2987524 RepID=A0ABT5K0M4_9BURK|nr:metallophosphoesterase family protein [Janthinobacterium fluminis]MDC8758271.1 metallophosphoesterase family protein [Janthinobacterium fluminis]